MSDVIVSRLVAASNRQEAWLNRVAKMLYEAGEMTAQTEGGPMPPWDAMTEILAGLQRKKKPGESQRARRDWYAALIHDHRTLASNLRDAASIDLVRELLTAIEDRQRDLERQLWQRIERAEKRAPGSLSRRIGDDDHG